MTFDKHRIYRFYGLVWLGNSVLSCQFETVYVWERLQSSMTRSTVQDKQIVITIDTQSTAMIHQMTSGPPYHRFQSSGLVWVKSIVSCMVALGGEKDNKPTNKVYTYDQQSRKWKQTIPPYTFQYKHGGGKVCEMASKAEGIYCHIWYLQSPCLDLPSNTALCMVQ